MNDERIENLAKAIWSYYYPNGGCIYATYESLKDCDKELHRKEAIEVAAFLDGEKGLIDC